MINPKLDVRVDGTRHYFESADGSPFFYLADTAWLLFGKLKEEEARLLFEDRATKGFTAVQAVVFRDFFEANTPNAYGVRPFASEADMFAVRMNPEWIEYVVRITKIAAEYGLVMCLLPTWGDKWNEHSNSAGPVIMDATSGHEYCRFLSDRLGDCPNVIWALGGDSPVQEQRHANTIRAMADGIRAGKSSSRLVTFYPSGLGSSGIFHSESWLDYNALQTSHYKPNVPGYLYIEQLFRTQPPKPCIDMEPNYEYSPMFIMGRRNKAHHFETSHLAFTPKFSAYDVRKSLYRTVLAGAAGFSYGCEPIRQLHREGDRIHVWPDEQMPTWKEALSAPGSLQLGLLPAVLLDRSYSTREAAQELFLPARQNGAWPDRMSTGISFAGQENIDPVAHISVARCTEGNYLMAYTPVKQIVTLDTSALKGRKLAVSIYDPESREQVHSFKEKNTGTIRIIPERDMDTFIVIDSA